MTPHETDQRGTKRNKPRKTADFGHATPRAGTYWPTRPMRSTPSRPSGTVMAASAASVGAMSTLRTDCSTLAAPNPAERMTSGTHVSYGHADPCVAAVVRVGTKNGSNCSVRSGLRSG